MGKHLNLISEANSLRERERERERDPMILMEMERTMAMDVSLSKMPQISSSTTMAGYLMRWIHTCSTRMSPDARPAGEEGRGREGEREMSG